eukprot:5879769-Heterocapsa_arctica.AAC.1
MQRDTSRRAGVEVPGPQDDWEEWEVEGGVVAVSRQAGREIAALENPYGGLNVPVEPQDQRLQQRPEELRRPARYKEMAAKL